MKGSLFLAILATTALGLMGPALANPQPPYSTTTTVVEWGGDEFIVEGTAVPTTLITNEGFVKAFKINGVYIVEGASVPTGLPCRFKLLPSRTELWRHPRTGGYDEERVKFHILKGVSCPS